MTLSDLLAALDCADPAARARDWLAREPGAAPLICGPAPRRLIPVATLRDWIMDETALPPWLIDASRKATGDLAEALALLLPATGEEPALTDVLADLATLPPGPLARTAILTMAHRLPDLARVGYFRLITGTYKPPLTAALLKRDPGPAPTRSILAVMIYAEAALATGARGPEITLAVWQGADLVPVARARTALTDAQTARLMAWVRTHATAKFGPLRAVPPQQVFLLGFAGATLNRRRRSGITLTDPVILDWLPDCDPAGAATHADLAITA
jgi:hypothetical protein